VLLAAELAGLDTRTMPELIYPPEEDFSFLSLLTSGAGRTLFNKTRLETPVLAYEWTVSPL